MTPHPTPVLRRVGTGLLALTLLVGVSACGDDDSDSSSDTAATSATTGATDPTSASSSSAGSCDYASISTSTDLASAPDITIPDCDPPAELVTIDIVEGDGDVVEDNSVVTAQYSGVSWSTGEEFDSSWSRGEPATFALLETIAGWEQGLPGMKVGGRRLLVIPPDLGYGEAGQPRAGIAPNETLVFVVDMEATR